MAEHIHDKENDYEAGTYWNPSGMGILHLPKLNYQRQYIEDTVHEVGHAVLHILDYADVLFDAHNSEAFTYLLGYLAGEVFSKDGYMEYSVKDNKRSYKQSL